MWSRERPRATLKLQDFRLCVRPGHGLVAHFPATILVVTATDLATMPAVDRILEECRTPAAGRPLPQRLAELVDDCGPAKLPAFCAIADDGDGLALFVHGDCQVIISGAQPAMRLSGGGGTGWTGGISAMVASLIVGPSTKIPEVEPTDAWVDLREGVVPGAAILLIPREPSPVASFVDTAAAISPPPRADQAPPGPALGLPPPQVTLSPSPVVPPASVVPSASVAPPAPEMPPAVQTPPAVQMPSAFEIPPAARTVPPAFEVPPAASTVPPAVAIPPAATTVPPAVELTPAASAVPPAAVDGSPIMVWGIHCKRGHFNNPDARYCRMCGMHMVHQRRDPVLGPRPVLGFLVLDDGSTYKLDADYVIGRDPGNDQAVRGGEARGLALSDPEESVSPLHAAIHLDKWDVFVTDLASRYGTHIWRPGTSAWERLEPGQKAMLTPRSHLLLGRRTMVFDSLNRR
jgi:hypothetical protein